MSERNSSDSRQDDRLICQIDVSSESGFNELKNLAKDSKFVCRGCGRAASTDEGLCQPEWIY